jgi:hypothetical protein
MVSLAQFFCCNLEFALRAALELCVMLANAFYPSIFEEDVGMAHVVGFLLVAVNVPNTSSY